MMLRKSRFWSLLLAYIFFAVAIGVGPVQHAVATVHGVAVYPKFKAFEPGTGNPLASGKLYTYLPGTTTLTNTYTDYTGTSLNTNPIILDANGECNLFYTGWLKLALYDASNVLVWTRDNVPYSILSDVTVAGGITGDNTGRIQGFSFGSASYADNGYFGNLFVKSSPWVDVRAYIPAALYAAIAAGTDTTNLHTYLQAAADNIPSTGGTYYVPRGFYNTGNVIRFQNKSNIKIVGDGMGQSTIRGVVDLGNASGSGSIPWGVITIEGDVNDIEHNAYLTDITLSMPNTTPASAPYMEHVLAINYVDNIIMDRVHIDGGKYEAVHILGPTSYWANVQCVNGKFTNTKFWSFNVNSGTVRNVIVSNNIFESADYGVLLTGTNLTVTNNQFYKPYYAISMGETNGAGRSIGASVVANNTIEGLGGNALIPGGTGTIYGIAIHGGLVSGSTAILDNVYDVPIIIANNIVTNSFLPDAGMGIIGINSVGNAKLIGNVITGLKGAAGDSRGYMISEGWGWDNASVHQWVYMDENTIEKGISPDQVEWQNPVMVSNADSLTAYLSGNKILGFSDNNAGLTITSNNDNAATVYLDGDHISGQIIDSSAGSVWGTVAASVTAGLPLYGSNKTGLRSNFSDDLLIATFDNAATTPSIAGGVIFKTANTGATTITNFTGGTKGKSISVVFTDNVTTVQNNADILLNGAADFESTPDDTLNLLYDGTKWREIYRSVN